MIPIKTGEEIKIMAEGGKILAGIMKKLEKQVRPGIKTLELNRLAESLVLTSGAKCSFKGYENFPTCLCTSVNNELVHAVPSDRVLKEGDIISLDLGIFFSLSKFLMNSPTDQSVGLKDLPGLKDGFHLDMAITLPVGKVDPETQRLIRITKKALKRGIKKAKIGNTFGDIGNTIQRYVESQGYNVVRELSGHGIGRELHEDPKILNYGKRRTGPEIKEGMVFCIEPMVTVGDWKLKKSGDGFGYQTQDDALSCHFEHTIAIIPTGNHQVLTELK